MAGYFESCSFSPNRRFLYVTAILNALSKPSLILQYDLNAANIAASKDTIYQIVDHYTSIGELKLAPDNKIYLSIMDDSINSSYPFPANLHNYITDNISVINSPDSLGVACDFQPFSIYLGGNRTYAGLPNNPDYTLGPLDTITAVHEIKNTTPSPNTLKIFYRSIWDIAFINADKLKGKKYVLTVFDITGKLIYKEEGDLTSQYFTKDLNMQSFSKGVYVVTLESEKERLCSRFVK